MALEQRSETRFAARVGIFLLGLLANTGIDYWYNFSVYPDLISRHGLMLGWLYAVAGSVALCLVTLWFYDVTRQDWLMLETIKELREIDTGGPVRRFFHKLANRGDWIAFVFLSMKYDPFVTTVYMRKSFVMTPRDWKIFWGSMVVANAYWGLVVFGILEGFNAKIAPYLTPDALAFVLFIAHMAQEFNDFLATIVTGPLRFLGIL